MFQPAYELIFALIAIVLITVGYGHVAQQGTPQPSSLLGHGLGIVGLLMMLCTETMYSLRKRWPGFHWGPTSVWLQFHIFTGLVGPYLVLLHTGWRFNGLAGVLTLLTVLIVLSGLVGRYIYTAVPRSLDGVAVAVSELEDQIADADHRLQQLGVDRLGSAAQAEMPQAGWALVLARPLYRWRQKRQFRQAIRGLDAAGQAHLQQLETLLAERHRLQLQIQSLDVTRRLLALWHLFHIPLGGVLFTLAFVHVFAALYYATLLK